MEPNVSVLAKPLFDSGAKKVFVSKCCGRLYVGVEKPKGCRTCKEPLNVEEVIAEQLGESAP